MENKDKKMMELLIKHEFVSSSMFWEKDYVLCAGFSLVSFVLYLVFCFCWCLVLVFKQQTNKISLKKNKNTETKKQKNNKKNTKRMDTLLHMWQLKLKTRRCYHF